MASALGGRSNAATAKVVILATGGTIAGAAKDSGDNVGYQAGQRTVDQLLAAVPALIGVPIEAEQVAQVDSKDMSHSMWWDLSRRINRLSQRPDVAGFVITHGTDTLEETAYWLHRSLDVKQPVVLTAAMRPATSLQADGPQNLLDAVNLAQTPGATGVLAVLQGRVWSGAEIRKVHSYRLDAFSAGDAGPLGWIEEGRLTVLRPWPPCRGPAQLPQDEPAWPWVEVVTSHAGASGRAVDALVEQGVQGLVVAATGNGSVHHSLLAALQRAQDRGVTVLRSTRCVLGHLVDDGNPIAGAGGLTPAQARVELMLQLLEI